jgi:uncharacterized protein (DUF2147 family)
LSIQDRPAEEVTMKRLIALAAFLLVGGAAQAQYTFDLGGRTIRIDPDRGTVSIPGVYDNTPRRKRSRNDHGSERSRKPSPERAKVDPPAVVPAPAQHAAPPSPAIAPTDKSAEPSGATANVAPATPASPLQTPPASTTLRSATTPLGLWLTQEQQGKIRIEQCGANLCGYSVDAKSNQNGEQILINMKPVNEAKWSGRILDPSTGSTYDSTIALQGPDTLRIQGCAMGDMFCGGQTWSRPN